MFAGRQMDLGAGTVASQTTLWLHNVADADPWIKWGRMFILEGGRGRWEREGRGLLTERRLKV